MKKKILLVDDDPRLCDELAELFRAEGYFVDSASDSAQGEILVRKNKYDSCLFDYKMKGLTGVDLLKIVKEVNPQCAVFIVSGRIALDQLIEKQKVADMLAGVIHKPFDIPQLLQKVRAFCHAPH